MTNLFNLFIRCSISSILFRSEHKGLSVNLRNGKLLLFPPVKHVDLAHIHFIVFSHGAISFLPSLYLNTRFVIDETAACKPEGMISNCFMFENMWLELAQSEKCGCFRAHVVTLFTSCQFQQLQTLKH